MRFYELMEDNTANAWIVKGQPIRLAIYGGPLDYLDKLKHGFPELAKTSAFSDLYSKAEEFQAQERKEGRLGKSATFDELIKKMVQTWFDHRLNAEGLDAIPDRSINNQRFAPVVKQYLQKQASMMSWQIEDLVVFNHYLDQYHNLKKEGKLGQGMSDEIMQIAKTIARDCEKFCRESDLIPVFRGANANKSEHFAKKMIRKDRVSASDQYGAFEQINDIMHNAGFKAIRTNGLNTTGDESQARGYGVVGIVFLIGDYDFTWSPKVKDYLNTLEDIDNEYIRQNGGDENSDGVRGDEMASLFWDEFGDSYRDQTNSTLKDAIRSKNEVLFTNDAGYYVLDQELFVEVAEHIALILNL